MKSGIKEWDAVTYGVFPRLDMQRPLEKCFIAYIHWVGWDCISFGFHVCFSAPNFELHFPFLFVKIGWQMLPKAK
jgi:hypothetical protein